MEGIKKKWKKYLTRTRSGTGAGSYPNPAAAAMSRKSKSWSANGAARRAAPDGCFAVYVGAERRRFVVKAKFANHPLFQMLLEEAELEYGYSSQGPISLPCDVEFFYQVLAEMDGGLEPSHHCGSSEARYAAALVGCSPLRLTSCGSRHGYGGAGYRLLSPSSAVKLNEI